MKNKFLIIIIFLELAVIGFFVIYPQIFKLESQINISVDPYQIVFQFNQPVVKSTFEKTFTIEPNTKGQFTWSDHNRQVIFKPRYLFYGSDYLVSIKNVRSWILTKLIKKDIKFRLEPPSSVNLASLERIFPVKLPISEKNVFTKPSGKTVEIAPTTTAEGKYIDIDISDQIMTTYDNGNIIGVYEISTGRYNMPTPTGKFSILSKEENHWSTQYNLWMPFSMRFYSGFFIHELPYWPSGYREGEDHLGTRVSHGCIRLGIGPAEEVFNFSDMGTSVVIHE
ncbi:MAG: L,D-transpeptidase [bacterium]